MKKLIKSTFKALVIGLAAVVFCATTAETSNAAVVAAPIAEFAGCGMLASVTGGAVGAGVGAAVGAGVGAVIGGIGVVACGTGFGIPVGVVCLGLAAVCGAIGAGVGSAVL